MVVGTPETKRLSNVALEVRGQTPVIKAFRRSADQVLTRKTPIEVHILDAADGIAASITKQRSPRPPAVTLLRCRDHWNFVSARGGIGGIHDAENVIRACRQSRNSVARCMRCSRL